MATNGLSESMDASEELYEDDSESGTMQDARQEPTHNIPSRQTASGYPIDIFTEESQAIVGTRSLLCFHCGQVLNNGIQLSCGGRACQQCIDNLINRSDGNVTCSHCEAENPEETHVINRDEIQPDSYVRNHIGKLWIKCVNYVYGCLLVLQLNNKTEYEEHSRVCTFHGDPEIFQNDSRPGGAVCGTCHQQLLGEVHIESMCKRLKEFEEKVYTVLSNQIKANSGLVNVLFNEVKTCAQQLVTTGQANTQEFSDIRTRSQAMETHIARLQTSVSDLGRNNTTDNMTFTRGKLLWRIDDWDQKRQEALDGTSTTLYSTPFSNEEAGYKMCARLYLNGDGIGAGTHMSLFFVMMRGQYDAVLSWPFTMRVTLKLLDQSGRGNHLQERFRPDVNSSSFQRPRSDLNVATGCPRFIALDDLIRRRDMYIKDNAMYIQVTVE